MSVLRPKAEEVIALCREIARFTEVDGEITRTFLAPAMHRVHALLRARMEAAGMQVCIDAIGNIRGVLAPTEAEAPRLLIGSHLDTVARAGAFDGILGVVLGIVLVEALRDSGEANLPFAIEVVGLSEEEGVRFSKPFLGSLALIGALDSALLQRKDSSGVEVSDAIRAFGLDPAAVPMAQVDSRAFAFFEIHIEQGPVLEAENLPLGIVDAIAGQTRRILTFSGHANHAGTTPMGRLRHDALASAAEWICEVERYAIRCEGLVATVGKLEVPGAASNVIPGRCVVSLDVRHPRDHVRHAAVAHLTQVAQAAAARRGVALTHETAMDQAAVPMNPSLVATLMCAVERSGITAKVLTSGAGHDAMILARCLPAAMLFLRSPGGISHHPDETVLVEDVEAALAAGLEFLRGLRDDNAMTQQLLNQRRESNA